MNFVKLGSLLASVLTGGYLIYSGQVEVGVGVITSSLSSASAILRS